MRTWALLAVAFLGGCTTIVPRLVARQIEHPARAPNVPGMATMAWMVHLERSRLRLRDGVDLVYWFGMPLANDVRQTETYNANEVRWSMTVPSWSYLADRPVRQKGTILLLPGWSMDALEMAPWGMVFEQKGYRVVLVDLPDQGGSSDAPPGFGPAEARDMAELVPNLELAGVIRAPLYLFGISYGADVALFTAARLTERPDGVVALEPFANAASTIRRLPDSGLFVPRWLGPLFTRSDINTGINLADHALGLDLRTLSPRPAMLRARSCLLIVRGSRDGLISRRGLAAMVQGMKYGQLITVPGYNHVTLALAAANLGDEFSRWFGASHAGQPDHCPHFHYRPDYPPFQLRNGHRPRKLRLAGPPASPSLRGRSGRARDPQVSAWSSAS